MIDIQEVFEIHQVLIQEFGGSQGVRDEGLLKSAIERPFSGFVKQSFIRHQKRKQVQFWKVLSKITPLLTETKGQAMF